MPADFEQYLWMGFYGDRAAPSGRYTVETLGEGMGQYNQVMLEVCGQRQIRCIDLAAEMNGRVEWFYDDVHFNEAGSRHVAEVMWRELADLLPPLD
jgi:hypothetical protein